MSTKARKLERGEGERKDVYERVTGQIVAAIEAGLARGDDRLPWHHDGQATTRPVNVASRRPYRGANVVALWAAAELAGYPIGPVGNVSRSGAELGAQGAQGREGDQRRLLEDWR